MQLFQENENGHVININGTLIPATELPTRSRFTGDVKNSDDLFEIKGLYITLDGVEYPLDFTEIDEDDLDLIIDIFNITEDYIEFTQAELIERGYYCQTEHQIAVKHSKKSSYNCIITHESTEAIALVVSSSDMFTTEPPVYYDKNGQKINAKILGIGETPEQAWSLATSIASACPASV